MVQCLLFSIAAGYFLFYFIFAGKIDLKRVILLEQTVMHLALNQGTFACSLGKFLSCQYDDVAYAIVVRSL